MVLIHISSCQCQRALRGATCDAIMVAQQGEFGNCPSLLLDHFLIHAGSKAGAGASGKLGTPWSPGYPGTAEDHPGINPSTGSNHSPSQIEESLQVSSLWINAKIPSHRQAGRSPEAPAQPSHQGGHCNIRLSFGILQGWKCPSSL